MIKFVFLVASIFSYQSIVPSEPTITPQEIQIVFSEEPIGFEGGQPVYPVSTRVIVKVPNERTLLITVDGGKEMEKYSKEVDITEHLGGRIGTHTVLVKTVGKDNETIQKIFGFNTK